MIVLCGDSDNEVISCLTLKIRFILFLYSYNEKDLTF